MGIIERPTRIDGDTQAKELQKFILWGSTFVRRQFYTLSVCFFIVSLLGSAYLLLAQPVYTASATMIIDLSKGQFFQKSVLGDSPTDSAWIDSQIGTLALQRDKIGLAVAKDLHLAIENDRVDPSSNALTSLISDLLPGQRDREIQAPTSDSDLTSRAGAVVANRLDIKRVGLSYLVLINYSTYSAEQAMKIANAAADAYVAAERDAKLQAVRQASDWLQERYQKLRLQAFAADQAVVEFKSANNIVTAGGKLINDQLLTEINTRLSAARARTADAQARLAQIEKILQTDQVEGTADQTVSDALANPIITRLRSQYLDLVNREADWSKRFGRNHLAVVNLRNQARDLRNSIRDELKRIAETYQSDYAIAAKNQAETEKQFANIVSQIPNDAQITLKGLETTAQSYRTYYDNFFQIYTQAVQQQTSPINETRVIAYSSGAYKSHPSTGRVIAITVFLAMVLGVGFGMMRETMDRAFRTPDQVAAALNAECISMVPAVPSPRATYHPQRRMLSNPQNVGQASAASLRIVNDAPFSRFSDAIRAIKLKVDSRGDRNSARVIGITSSIPKEGKSTIASALTGLFSDVGQKVILVDCDLRNPALSRMFTPNATAGIIEVLTGDQTLETAIWHDSAGHFAFLPAVNTRRVANTDQVLASDGMKQLFEVLRKQYDYIVVDLSPLAPIVDVRATTELVDSYLFIVEWGETKIGVAQHALNEANVVREKLLGIVLNKVDMKVIPQYVGWYAEYYHNRDFERYQHPHGTA